MCKSIADGGQRCAAHTRPRFEAAAPGTREWDEAAAEYAATREGRARLAELVAAAAEGGDYETEAQARAALAQGEKIRDAAQESAQRVDLQNSDPVTIDEQLAEHYYEAARERALLAGHYEHLRHLVDQRGFSASRRDPLRGQDLEDAIERVRSAGGYRVRDVDRTLAKIDASRESLARSISASQVLDAEFQRRGGWSRAFLVDNTNGHVHRDMNCSTCHDTTQYVWMTQYSGKGEDEIVADAGNRACTCCYPSAPVDVLSRPTKMYSPAEMAAQQAREARAAAKVERDRKRLEKAVLPDGSDLKWSRYGTYTERTSTLTGARKGLVDLLDYRGSRLYDDSTKSGIVTLSEAIAAKEGKTPDVVIAEAEERLRRRR